ncbi:MAG: amino acid ABC transporter permease [Comamonadaceae bacterium]|nr:MAG: amino acid ABC transporter permease [Comamonadaceae bacterium]
MGYNWNWRVFQNVTPDGSGTYLQLLASGFAWTLGTALCAWVLALFLGSLIGMMRTSASPWASRLARAYVELFRNVPILVQLFLWYFVLPEVLPQAMGDALKQMPQASFITAVLGIGFYMSSRVAEQVRAGINSLPRGQSLAGKALGFTTFQTYRYVLMPVSFRIIMPPLTSEFLATIKNTAIAMTIGLVELTGAARSMQEYTFQVFEAFTAAMLVYLALNLSVTYAMRFVEERFRIPGLVATR